MNLASIFINRFGRLRSGWRFAVFVALFVAIGGALGVFAVSILSLMQIGYTPQTPVFLGVNGILSLAAGLIAGWLAGKWLEGLPFRALGALPVGRWLRNLMTGLLIGGASVTLAVGLAAFGGYSIHLNSSIDGITILRGAALSFVILAAAAAFEEALFRGYVLQTFSRAGLAWLAIALTSLLFGAVHYGNPNAGVISSINTGLAGVWLGVAYLKTRDLWFPFGVHLMWNWMQGSIFGIEISGLTDLSAAPVFREIDNGPAWLTGGPYGIEGGIACTAALVVSTAAIYFLPFLRPSEEMLALTSRENSNRLDLK